MAHAAPWRGGAEDPWSWLQHTPLALLVAGKPAVIVFFILSGFVLTLGFEGRHVSYAGFAVRRFIRIWAPFAAAVSIAVVLQLVVAHGVRPIRSPWFRGSWNVFPTWRVVAEHLAMTGRTIELDNPMWSLVHEMRVSLIFPLVVWLVRRAPRVALAGTMALSIVAAKALPHLSVFPVDQALETAGYVVFFAVGALAALHRNGLNRVIEAVGPRWRAAAWIAALWLLLLCPAAQIQAMGVRGAIRQLAAGLGACGVVLLCRYEGAVHRRLVRGAPLWLGRISYSLYLIHVPVLLAVGYALPTASPLATCAIGVPLAFAAAEALHWLVENPSIRFSRAAEMWVRKLMPTRH